MSLFPGPYAADRPEAPPPWNRLATLLILAAYLTVAGHRPITYIPGSTEDDQLFARLALELASGRWLGPYDQNTLVKGIGFPAFLCLNYMVGLPVNLSLCLCYAAACWYFARVLRPLLRSQAGEVALFALLLFLPPAASAAAARIDRDFFCTALALGGVAAAINLTMTRTCPLRPLGAAALAGTLGAWFWVTREEGVWLLPTLGLIALAGWWTAGFPATIPLRAGAALAIALSLIGGIGLVNRIVYGRFELTEMGTAPFQSALVALERAAAADWVPYVPVPLAARRRIYARSPSFARLKPFLDPDQQGSVWAGPGCDTLPTTCGDIAGGWFVWALRDAAARLGVMSDPNAAAAFFGGLEAEVAGACRDGRLTCAAWLPPLVPPFTWDQARKFPRQLRDAASFATLGEDPDAYGPVDPLSGLELQTLELTSVPEHGPGRIIVLRGHAEGGGPAPFRRTDTTGILSAQWPSAPAPGNGGPSPVALTLACLFDPCGVRLGTRADTAVEVPLEALPSGPFDIPGWGRVSFDAMDKSPLTLRSRAAQAFGRALAPITMAYHVFVLVGLLALGAAACRHAVGRVRTGRSKGARRFEGAGSPARRGGIPPSPSRPGDPSLILLALALGLAALARTFLIALVDATSFQAIGYMYMLPLLPFSAAAAALAIADCLQAVAAPRRPSARRARQSQRITRRDGTLWRNNA